MTMTHSVMLCLFIAAVVFCDILMVQGSLDIRSHYNGRIKGERRGNGIHSQHRELANDPRQAKHAGNLLHTFDRVWSDASSVKVISTIATKCIKKKKEKKKEIGGTGVIGVGSGKGSGKGAGANGDATAVSNTTSTSNSTATSSVTGSNSTRASAGTNSTRLLDTTTNTTNSTVTSSENITMYVVIENSGSSAGRSKKGKGSPKVAPDGVLYCEEDDNDSAVGTPSAPVVSPIVPPAGSPSASVGLPVGSPVAVTAPVVLTPTGNVSSPVVPTGGAQASVCEAYAFGEAPTSAPSQNYTAFMVMTVNASADIDSIYTQIGTILREEIAPMLLNCDSVRRKAVRRQLQDNATELVNIRFTDPTANPSGSCTPPSDNSSTCVPCMFMSEVFYFGEEPAGFDDKLVQAILYEQFDIPGLESFEEVQVTEDDGADDPNTDPAPGPGPTDRGLPPTSSPTEESTQSSKNGPNPGAFVAVAAAALTVILLALFVVRRRRDATSTGSQAKHMEFTDDIDDDVGGETGDDNSANTSLPPPARKSYILSDQSLDDSWNSTGNRANEGQEVYTTSRQQSQTRFLTADVGFDPTLTGLPRREYEIDDTVNL